MKNALIGYSRCWMTRQAFRAAGVLAFTCDLLPAREDDPAPELHLQMDIHDAIALGGWDFGLFHPMCTYLTVSAAWAYKAPNFEKYPGVGYHMRVKPGTLTDTARRAARAEAIENFQRLLTLPFPCELENPALNFVSAVVGPPDQVIQPYEFGDDASKATGLWFNDAARRLGLPLLEHTGLVPPRYVESKNGVLPRWSNQTDSGQNNLTPTDDRWLDRSATYPGIAAALGAQHGSWLARLPGVDNPLETWADSYRGQPGKLTGHLPFMTPLMLRLLAHQLAKSKPEKSPCPSSPN